jgi:hypothetical protein
MEARTAVPQDLTEVFRNVADRLSREYKAAGGSEESAKDVIMMNLREGRGHALLQDGKLVAVIAWHEDHGVAFTDFAANESFFSASTVRFCKMHIRRIQALCGNLPVRYHRWSDRKDTDRWFKLLGFEKISTQGSPRVYELPVRAWSCK